MKRVLLSLLLVMLCASSVFAAQTVTETYTLHTTENISAEVSDLGQGLLADVPAVIEKEGKTYKAVSATAEVAKEETRVEVKRTFTDATKADPPKTIKKNGVKLKLEKDNVKETVVVRDAVTGSHSWTGCNKEPDIPESLTLTTDSGLEVTAYLQNVESRHSDMLAEYEFPATFIGDEDCQYYVINGKRIPNTFEEPTFEGYEEEILTYLNLPADDYDITGGSWTSGDVTEDGRSHRLHCILCGKSDRSKSGLCKN